MTLPGEGANAGKLAVVRGPQVLAVDAQYNPGLTPGAAAISIRPPQLKTSGGYRDADGGPVYEMPAVVTQDTESFSREFGLKACLEVTTQPLYGVVEQVIYHKVLWFFL